LKQGADELKKKKKGGRVDNIFHGRAFMVFDMYCYSFSWHKTNTQDRS
jgi:hypothetical protein